MSTVSQLLKEFACCICLRIFDESQILKQECWHTVCLKCVQKLKSMDWVSCPLCHSYTHDVQNDFTIHKLIELYQEDQTESLEKQNTCRTDATQNPEPVTTVLKSLHSTLESTNIDIKRKKKTFDNKLAKLSGIVTDVQDLKSRKKQNEKVLELLMTPTTICWMTCKNISKSWYNAKKICRLN